MFFRILITNSSSNEEIKKRAPSKIIFSAIESPASSLSCDFYVSSDQFFVYPYRRNKITFCLYPLLSQHTLFKKANFIFYALLVFVFIVSTTLLTVYFGGISIYKCIRSRSVSISKYSHSW